MKGDVAGQGVVPLRTILRNILNLIDSFETRYKEGLDSYDQEFQVIYFSCKNYVKEDSHTELTVGTSKLHMETLIS